MDFRNLISNANMLDISFHGNKYTWCNNRFYIFRISTRLDQFLSMTISLMCLSILKLFILIKLFLITVQF